MSFNSLCLWRSIHLIKVVKLIGVRFIIFSCYFCSQELKVMHFLLSQHWQCVSSLDRGVLTLLPWHGSVSSLDRGPLIWVVVSLTGPLVSLFPIWFSILNGSTFHSDLHYCIFYFKFNFFSVSPSFGWTQRYLCQTPTSDVYLECKQLPWILSCLHHKLFDVLFEYLFNSK